MLVTVLLSERVLLERAFKGLRLVRVGRHPGSEIHLDNLGVSRLHCEFEEVGGGAWIVRDRSEGRTFVNGAPIVVHDLADGDLVTLGKFTLAVTLEEAARAQTVQVGVGAATMLGTYDAGRETSLTRPLAHLVEVETGETTLLLDLHTSIGSGKHCDLRLSGWLQPRVAAVFVREEASYRVVDTSAKGDSLSVGGTPCRVATLSFDDEIEVRGRRFLFRQGEPEGAA